MDEYVNKFKENRATLESYGVKIQDDIWSALFLSGLTENYSPLIRELLSTELKSKTFEEVIQLAFNEELTKFTTDALSNGNGHAATADLKKTERCKFCRKGHDSMECWKKYPEKAPEWFQEKQKAKDKAKAGVKATNIDQIDPDLLERIQDEARSSRGLVTTINGYVS